MSQKEEKLLRSSLGVSIATLASRIMGLIRVRMEAMALGGGTVASIWFLTLMIPNLLRRLFGEGALGTALTPLIAESEREKGIFEVRCRLAQVLSLLGAFLALIVIVVSTGAWLLGKYSVLTGSDFLQSDRVLGVCKLLPFMMPYAFFICLTGVITAVLNFNGMFVRPALTALLFNLCMISGLISGVLFKLESGSLLTLLAILTPAAGAVQLLLMLWMLRCCGWFPFFCKSAFRDLSMIVNLIKLATPGIIGYGVVQLSFIIDRLLALYLGDQAVPALTYVDRIVDLPIGLFAVSLGTVLMASMTHAATEKDWHTMRKQLNFSLRHVWFVCAPLAAAVMFFHTGILRVLCLGGKYTVEDLEAAQLVAVFYGMGIPLFCSLKVILPAFYSRKDMKRPFYVSLTAIAVNIVLNILLMFPLKQGGLALATVVASAVNNSILLLLLAKDGFKIEMNTFFSCFRSVILALVSAAVVWLLQPLLYRSFSPSFGSDCLILCLTGIAFSVFYLVLVYLFSGVELRELISVLQRKNRASVKKTCKED